MKPYSVLSVDGGENQENYQLKQKQKDIWILFTEKLSVKVWLGSIYSTTTS